MKKIWLLVLISVHFLFLQAQDNVFTPQQLKQDFDVFRRALIEAHPGMYRYTTKKEWNESFRKVENALNKPLTEEAFFRLLNPLVAQIHCTHTKFHRQGRPDDLYAFHQDSLFPLKLYFKDNKAFILQAYKGKGPSAGSELISINNKPVQEIMKQLFQNIYADGHVTSTKYQELNHRFAGYYTSFIGCYPQFTIAYLDAETGKQKTLVLTAVSLADINQAESPMVKDSLSLSFLKGGTALLRIPVFMPQEDGTDYATFLQTAFGEINRRKTTDLIIDLRNNEGGMDQWGSMLYSWLTDQPFPYYDHLSLVSMPPYSFQAYATVPPELDQYKEYIKKQGNEYRFTLHPNLSVQQPQANPYKGRLYILQNGLSLSVTSEFCSIVRDQHRGIFIGEENGGAISGNNSGTFLFVQLPNTRLNLDIPILGYYMKLSKKHPLDRGVLPEYNVVPSVTDVLQQKDIVLDTTLALIEKTK